MPDLGFMTSAIGAFLFSLLFSSQPPRTRLFLHRIKVGCGDVDLSVEYAKALTKDETVLQSGFLKLQYLVCHMQVYYR